MNSLMRNKCHAENGSNNDPKHLYLMHVLWWVF